MSEEQQVAITRTEKGTGWVLFAPCPGQPPSPEATPLLLSRSVAKWVQQNSIIEVREILPFVANGNTVGIHAWFD
jgi:hypothetical protein